MTQKQEAIAVSGGRDHADPMQAYCKHPFSEHRDWDGYPFLHLLCDGSLVKL